LGDGLLRLEPNPNYPGAARPAHFYPE
jgi:hypothetical protein